MYALTRCMEKRWVDVQQPPFLHTENEKKLPCRDCKKL